MGARPLLLAGERRGPQVGDVDVTLHGVPVDGPFVGERHGSALDRQRDLKREARILDFAGQRRFSELTLVSAGVLSRRRKDDEFAVESSARVLT